jgi:hypothetical protein
MPKTQISITATQAVKSGQNPKTGKTWTLFRYDIEKVKVGERDYDKFTSFNVHQVGKTELELEEVQNGQWWNLREASNSKMGQIGAKLAELERRIASLEALTKKGKIEPELPTVSADLDIDF